MINIVNRDIVYDSKTDEIIIPISNDESEDFRISMKFLNIVKTSTLLKEQEELK